MLKNTLEPTVPEYYFGHASVQRGLISLPATRGKSIDSAKICQGHH